MALVEVDEGELQSLRGSRALLGLLEKNPSIRARAMELLKEAEPRLSVPEVEAKREVKAEVDAVKKEFADFKASITKKEEEAEKKRLETSAEEMIGKGRRKLQKLGYGKEAVDAIEKMMETRGLIDYEAAAALWDKEHPPEATSIESTVNWSAASDLMNPTETNPWKKAIDALNQGVGRRGVDNILRRTQNDQINQWFRENRNQARVRA